MSICDKISQNKRSAEKCSAGAKLCAKKCNQLHRNPYKSSIYTNRDFFQQLQYNCINVELYKIIFFSVSGRPVYIRNHARHLIPGVPFSLTDYSDKRNYLSYKNDIYFVGILN